MQKRHEAAERIGAALATMGMARLPARLFAALLVDDDGRMTAAELAGFLQVSAGGISGGVRYLERVGLVRREREPGSRRDVYVVDDDAWHNVMMTAERTYAPIRSALSGASASLQDTPAAVRLGLSVEFFEFLIAELATLTSRWEERRRALPAAEAVPGSGRLRR